MEEAIEIINKVAQGGLTTLDLEQYYHQGERIVYDLKNNLFMEQILREKDFRAFLKSHNWNQYSNKNVAITCSVDAIIPMWAYMLLAGELSSVANCVVFGDLSALENKLFYDAIARINLKEYQNARVVIKGCGNFPVPVAAYVEIIQKLRPVVQSLMFGEPCSTVPLYKRKPLATV